MKYPNLELIEYITENTANEVFKSDLVMSTYNKFRMFVFPQTWSSTALGFNKQCCFSGQAITEAYTVVVEMTSYQPIVNQEKSGFDIKELDKVYAVFFDSKLAYMCLNPNQEFFDDLNKMCMKSQKESEKYEDDDDSRVSI